MVDNSGCGSIHQKARNRHLQCPICNKSFTDPILLSCHCTEERIDRNNSCLMYHKNLNVKHFTPIAGIVTDMLDFGNENRQLKVQVNEQQTRIQSLENDNQQQQIRIQSLENHNQQQQIHIQSLENDNKQQQIQINQQQQTQINQIQQIQINQQLQTQINQIEINQQLQTRIQSLANDNKQLKHQINRQGKIQENQNTELRRLQEDYQRLKTCIERMEQGESNTLRNCRTRFSRSNGYIAAREPGSSSSPINSRHRFTNVPDGSNGYSTNSSTRSADNNRIDPPIDHAILNSNGNISN